MDSFEINKILTAVLVVFLVIFGIGKISDIVFHVEKPNTSAYKVEFAEVDQTKASSSVQTVDIAALLALGTVAFGKDWTFDEMNNFLIKPTTYIKGTKMAFAGLKKEKDRASVILYMNANSDSPLDLP